MCSVFFSYLFFPLRFKIPSPLSLLHVPNYIAGMNYIKGCIPAQADVAVLTQPVAHHVPAYTRFLHSDNSVNTKMNMSSAGFGRRDVRTLWKCVVDS